jgi:hypothetical protein
MRQALLNARAGHPSSSASDGMANIPYAVKLDLPRLRYLGFGDGQPGEA